MKRVMTMTALSLVAVFSLAGSSGCGTDGDVAEQSPRTTETEAADLPADLPAEVAAELDGLSESDRALAMAQRTCPVTGKLLGSMGEPPKVLVEGREVFLCCAACEDRLRSDPQQYFQKLDADDN